ncbi:MAG: PIN domain-containing protein [Ruminococcus sp.]|jgi:predicted nucleic acid-binding protein|nr:PIN domain-containing protein [Ruminococcus sp.]
MRVVFDNNILIDVLRPNPEFEADSKSVFQLAGSNKISPFICANSLTDIFYILNKVHGSLKAKKDIAKIISIFNIIPLDVLDCIKALRSQMNDFEDAIIAVSAEKIDADYIVTRDEKFLKSSCKIKIVTPQYIIDYMASKV